MIVSIHQPNYLPYIGFFHKVMCSDVFVIYDTAQFVKDRFDNRNKIPRTNRIRGAILDRNSTEASGVDDVQRA